jgi:hypothetical protein
MKKSIRRLMPILLLPMLALVFSASCRKGASIWKGTMQTENGVVIVENPAEPLYKNASLDLTEELSIGGKNATGDSELAEVYRLDVDSANNIYVLDHKLSIIKVFNMDGRFVQTVGANGQGPGEYQAPSCLKVIQDQELVVYDIGSKKMIYYSLAGKCLREKKCTKRIGQVLHIDEKGVVYAASVNLGPTMVVDFMRISPDCESITPIAKKETKDYLKQINPVPSEFYSSVFRETEVIWGESKEYVLYIEEDSGKLLRIIRKKGSGVKISEEDKAAIIKNNKAFIDIGIKLDIAECYPFFEGISTCEDKLILVNTYEKTINGSADYYDVFDAEGRYVAKISLLSGIKGILWKNEKLYCVAQDKEGFPLIKRYAVRWNFE